MGDVFIEYMVRRKNTPKVMLTKLGIVAAALLVAVLAMAFGGLLGPFSMLSPLVAVGACYGAWHLATAQNVEFEYAVTNGEIDFDKIVAQRKRTRFASVNCREVEGFGRYKASEHRNREYQGRIFACDSPDSEGLWYLVTRVKDKGLTLIVFNANDKMINGIKPFLPRPIMHEAFNKFGG